MQSETIGALIAALCKARGEFAPATKESTNPHFRSKYADLETVVNATFPSLVKHGLFVIQTFCGDTLETMLAHESGEWIKGTQPLLGKQDPQGIASASTYARRYGLMAILGVAPEDDDGNTAQKSYLEAKEERIAPAQEPKELQSVLTVASVEPKTTANKKTFFLVTFGDGSTATTFSSTLAELAMSACADKRLVDVTVEPKEANGKHFYNIKAIV